MKNNKDQIITLRLRAETVKRIKDALKEGVPEVRNRSQFIEAAVEAMLDKRPAPARGHK